MPAMGNPEALFDCVEDTIEAFRNREFIVVLDSADRENEGDLIIAAEAVTTEQMAFMIRHTSGLICAPMPPSYTDRLALPPMLKHNADPHQTAYTVTVDAAHPAITTGISAHDRALTCRTLASAAAVSASTLNGSAASASAPNGTAASKGAAALRRPGHVLPLRAQPGGVRERAGHTEAAVEFCRLAGLRSRVGVISELVDDGEEVAGVARRMGGGMMRRDACVAFARRWGLRVCTIEGLREYLARVEGEGVVSDLDTCGR